MPYVLVKVCHGGMQEWKALHSEDFFEVGPGMGAVRCNILSLLFPRHSDFFLYPRC